MQPAAYIAMCAQPGLREANYSTGLANMQLRAAPIWRYVRICARRRKSTFGLIGVHRQNESPFGLWIEIQMAQTPDVD